MSPFTCCTNFWLFVSIFFVLPFFLYSFLLGIYYGAVMPGIIQVAVCPNFYKCCESSPNEERGCVYKTLVFLFFVLCILPYFAFVVTFLVLVVVILLVGAILNTPLTVILLLPRLIYLAFLWYRWTSKRNLLVRRTS